jgi:hypothetical protein
MTFEQKRLPWKKESNFPNIVLQTPLIFMATNQQNHVKELTGDIYILVARDCVVLLNACWADCNRTIS